MERTSESLDNARTVDSILSWFKNSVQSHAQIRPSQWIDAAQMLVSLMGEESDKLYTMQSAIARMKITMLEADAKRNVSAVKLAIEATPEWVTMMQQKSKIDQITEFVRVAKVQSRIRMDELRNQV